MVWLKIVPFALLITTGFYKASVQDLSIDITVLTAMITIISILVVFIKSNYKINKAILLVVPLFILVLPSIHFGNLTEYAKDKTVFWYTLTFISIVAPLFIIKTKKDLSIFKKVIIAIMIIMCVNAMYNLITQQGLVRLTALGSSTIALGRANGILFIYIFIYTLQKKIRYRFAVPLLCLIALLLISSGSKGPILFTIVTVFMVFAIFKWRNKTIQAVAIALSIIVLIGFVSFNKDLIPQTSFYRVQEFLSGGVGTSTSARLVVWENSIGEISVNPIGVGFGNSEQIINRNMKTPLVYPHNIILEAFLECGWLYGLFFVFFLGFSAIKAYKTSLKDRDFIVTFALLIFLLLNSMVSGEMNDRMLFAFIGLALSYKPKVT